MNKILIPIEGYNNIFKAIHLVIKAQHKQTKTAKIINKIY